MNDFVTTLSRWTVRIVLVLVGLVFVASLIAAAALLALIWGIRALWAKLTGQPITPWAMRMNPRTGWETVYRSGAQWMAQAGSGERSQRGYAAGRRAGALPGAGEVTDVQPREVREP
ncbi:hypothetical protein [Comamonas composti]|uniref:hypothetical protein n=1 Tax=Comamonas composti TaxID=408558 RepID=UPI00040E03BD|nr:hypothetical protein [Comamonas composti]